MLQQFMVEEAVNSIAIEHGDTCDCLICRAAAGDQRAWSDLYIPPENVGPGAG